MGDIGSQSHDAMPSSVSIRAAASIRPITRNEFMMVMAVCESDKHHSQAHIDKPTTRINNRSHYQNI